MGPGSGGPPPPSGRLATLIHSLDDTCQGWIAVYRFGSAQACKMVIPSLPVKNPAPDSFLPAPVSLLASSIAKVF